MIIHWGAVPEDPDFHPENEGWSPIREPGPLAIQFIALPVAMVVVGLLVGLLALVWPSGSVSGSIWLLLALAILLIPIHEILHAVCFPGGLPSPHTIIGIWLSRILFYAHYEGVMTRTRFLVTFAMPFLVLSILPIMLVGLLRWPSLELAALSIVNGAAASGDIIGIILVGLQVPASASVRNRGWRTYWRYSP
ncbi:MAG TPA: DUF3267 domain-containing protein [Anaerolineae bacterium]|nr:DUF3267 domain-containing protein [Anaerolineae bacterium]MCB0179154.1 DUF3267 domain-containing protein [Anaerolineae bacterium]MCB0222278.1 DUF3267 domain-containing protein [Anaerolineae bacterium]MCB9104427.1 DUF3267 domain-containing protein [Anaerolineales bacterium]HRV93147.1 DUF3267 domain-containing protein [Anaerolineae bacterium]